LLGFSRNGYYVEYAITHSSFPFAAAVSADNWDPSYVAQTLLGYGVASESVNGGPPFGETLAGWLDSAPAFNAERVQAPLLMIEQSLGRFGILLRWELHSRLRYLGKPVEFYLIPHPDRGAHLLHNPEQALAVQHKVISWMDHYLLNRERTAASHDRRSDNTGN
jgi:dipeptidyl aminopeptidase/acylaminoacyl peptidase